MKTKIKMNNGDEYVVKGTVQEWIEKLTFEGSATNRFSRIEINNDHWGTSYKYIVSINVCSIEEHNE